MRHAHGITGVASLSNKTGSHFTCEEDQHHQGVYVSLVFDNGVSLNQKA